MAGDNKTGTGTEVVAGRPEESGLTPQERGALTAFRVSGQAPVSPATAERFYLLFLRGLDPEGIRQLVPSYSLGQIVNARVQGKWDQKRAEYDESLVSTSAEAVTRARLEVCAFLGDALAATVAHGRERYRKYLVTGDEKELGDFKLGNLKGIKDALELLLKATGQADVKRVAGDVHHHVHAASPVPTPGQAADVVAALLGKG